MMQQIGTVDIRTAQRGDDTQKTDGEDDTGVLPPAETTDKGVPYKSVGVSLGEDHKHGDCDRQEDDMHDASRHLDDTQHATGKDVDDDRDQDHRPHKQRPMPSLSDVLGIGENHHALNLCSDEERGDAD